jgi:hypothetical protein
MRYEREIITGTVHLDGSEFIHCTFERCDIIYSGGPYRIETPTFGQGVRLAFAGAAIGTLMLLQQIRGTLPEWFEQIMQSRPLANMPIGKT